jgi:hypothetical protein
MDSEENIKKKVNEAAERLAGLLLLLVEFKFEKNPKEIITYKNKLNEKNKYI